MALKIILASLFATAVQAQKAIARQAGHAGGLHGRCYAPEAPPVTAPAA
jgi:hypothetical protein